MLIKTSNIIMKSIFLFLLVFFVVHAANSQNSKCHNIYVWDIVDENNQKNNYTKDLTNAVEEAFVNLGECQVLQRRNIGSLQSQLENEKNIQSVRDLKSNTINSLSTNGAELVVFGTLTTIGKKEFELQLRIENLSTTKIVRMKSIDLEINDLVDNPRKRRAVAELVEDLIIKQGGSKLEDPPVTPGYKVKNCLNGYEIKITSCIGNIGEQTATISFEFKHNRPHQNLSIHSYKSTAYGNKEEFKSKFATLGNDKGASPRSIIPTDITITGSITLMNVLPSNKKIDKALISLNSYNKDGGGDRQNCQLEISNLTIQW